MATVPDNVLARKGTAMDSLLSRFHDFLRDEEGPTAVEYAGILAVIIGVCLAAISVLGSNASGKFNEVAQTIQ